MRTSFLLDFGNENLICDKDKTILSLFTDEFAGSRNMMKCPIRVSRLLRLMASVEVLLSDGKFLVCKANVGTV